MEHLRDKRTHHCLLQRALGQRRSSVCPLTDPLQAKMPTVALVVYLKKGELESALAVGSVPVTSLVMTWSNVINLQNRTAVSTAVFVTSQPMATKLCHVLQGSCPTRPHSSPGEVGPKRGKQMAISTTPVYKNDSTWVDVEKKKTK